MNLVYACVFYNEQYIRLLELLLLSLRFYSKRDSFDILVITSESFHDSILTISNKLDIHIKLHCLPCTSIFEAACARLHIFEWPEITSYNKILYLDTDILIRRDISPLFTYEINGLYGIPSGTLKSLHFGGQFFDFSTVDSSRPGINSGTLLFNNTEPIRELFSNILQHCGEYASSGKPLPYALDQPFINYHAYMSGLTNIELLPPYISLYEDTLHVDNADTAMVCHFSYPIGNFAHKYSRMSEFFKGLLTEKKTGTLDLAGRRYSWGVGFLTFNTDTVQTTWGQGTFTVLGDTIVSVIWNRHEHILKFSGDLSEYMSIRIAPRDFDCVLGSLSDATFSADKRDE
jgi:hypothetical protein